MRKHIKQILVPVCVLLISILSACHHEPISEDPSELAAVEVAAPASNPTFLPTNTAQSLSVRPRSWYTNAHIDWEHDGSPFESEHFWVYSDAARMYTKEQFALDAEAALIRILPLFEDVVEGVVDVRFLYPKMEIFISSQHYGEVSWQGLAHHGGFLIVYDAENFRNSTHTFPDYFPYSYVVAHELTHVLSSRLAGNRGDNFYDKPHAWFEEGLAGFLGGHPTPIRTLQMYEIAMEGVANRSAEGNPIYIRYVPLPGYPENLYELAVYYLIETYGIENVIAVFMDMRTGDSFEIAFENRIGMSVDDYQREFDTLIREFFAED